MLSLFGSALLCGEWVGLNRKNVSFSDRQQGNQILRSAAIDRERGSDLFIAGRLEHFPVPARLAERDEPLPIFVPQHQSHAPETLKQGQPADAVEVR